jgi:hypothetical protein
MIAQGRNEGSEFLKERNKNTIYRKCLNTV